MRKRIYLYSAMAVITGALAVRVLPLRQSVTTLTEAMETPSSTTPEPTPTPGSITLTVANPAVASVRIPVHRTVEEAPGWSVPYGSEFWRAPQTPAPQSINHSPLAGNVSLGDIIARVSHAIAEPSPGALPMAQSLTYSATFDGQGFRLSPKLPAGFEEVVEAGSIDPALSLEEPSVKARARYQDDPATEVMFRTVSIQQGSDSLYSWGGEAVAWSVVGNTAQGLLSSSRGILEHYECSQDGVEVTWVLRNKPEGTGPLQIDAQLTGLTYAGLSEDGHLFADASGNPRIKVGQVQVVDAQGVRTELPLLVENTRLKVTVPSELMESATFPLAIDPVIGPVVPMSFCMETHSQYAPAVASNGTNYLAVWSDRRVSSNQIYMTVIDVNGKVASPNGVLVTTNGTEPRVASDGIDYLVVWTDNRNATNFPTYTDIYGNRIGSSGTVLDGNGFAICTSSNRQDHPDVASRGRGADYVVVWEDEAPWGGSGYSDIIARQVTSGGTVSTNITVSDWTTGSIGTEYWPKLASDGTNFLAVWNRVDTNSIPHLYMRSIRGTGTPLYNSVSLLQTNASDHGLSSAKIAGKYLVTFGQTASNGLDEVRGRFVQETGGTNTVGSLLTVNTNYVPLEGRFIVSASNGTNHLVSWSSLSDTNVYGTLVRASDGVILTTNGFLVNAAGRQQVDVAVASNGRDFLAAWMDGISSDPITVDNDIFAARVRASDGRALDVIPVSTTNCVSNPTQSAPAVAGDDNGNFLVAWVDSRNSGTTGDDIYATRVDGYGAVHDPSGIAICTATNAQSEPDIAWNGSAYLVVWTDKRSDSSGDIHGTRVNTSGVVLDSGGIAISTATGAQTLADVASDGASYMVVWQDVRGSTLDVFGAAIASNGTNLNASGFGVSTNTGNQGYPAISWNGSNYLTVWTDTRISGNDIYGARIGTNSIVIDTSGFAVCNVTQSQHRVQIAHIPSSTNCLVVWQDSRNTATSTDIYGTLVSQSAAVNTTGFAINTASGVQNEPSVGASGSDYLVAWSASVSPYGVNASRITSGGSVQDPTGSELIVSVTPSSPVTQDSAAVAYSSSTYLVCYRNLFGGTAKISAATLTP